MMPHGQGTSRYDVMYWGRFSEPVCYHDDQTTTPMTPRAHERPPSKFSYYTFYHFCIQMEPSLITYLEDIESTGTTTNLGNHSRSRQIPFTLVIFLFLAEHIFGRLRILSPGTWMR
jgi:hypothetical protein